jgi:hypothetical protein
MARKKDWGRREGKYRENRFFLLRGEEKRNVDTSYKG